MRRYQYGDWFLFKSFIVLVISKHISHTYIYIHKDICKAPIQEEDLSAHTKTLNKEIHNAQIIIK